MVTKTRSGRDQGEREARIGGQYEADVEDVPNCDEVLRSMHEATERARNDVVHWLIFREKMAKAVADFRAITSPHPTHTSDDGEGRK